MISICSIYVCCYINTLTIHAVLSISLRFFSKFRMSHIPSENKTHIKMKKACEAYLLLNAQRKYKCIHPNGIDIDKLNMNGSNDMSWDDSNLRALIFLLDLGSTPSYSITVNIINSFRSIDAKRRPPIFAINVFWKLLRLT